MNSLAELERVWLHKTTAAYSGTGWLEDDGDLPQSRQTEDSKA